ncbi:hypothetical protein [Bradyrhizobium nanningense]|uniref:hypothetical protein n=1 Tax=Bradyrhizobium nanningense TaxID=1325118 RepID=UPI0019D6C5B2|nr:hypothetical protein [Bradyrhizobium nanningense]
MFLKSSQPAMRSPEAARQAMEQRIEPSLAAWRASSQDDAGFACYAAGRVDFARIGKLLQSVEQQQGDLLLLLDALGLGRGGAGNGQFSYHWKPRYSLAVELIMSGVQGGS